MTERPSIPGILETILYAEDLEEARRFYGEVLGLTCHWEPDGRQVFFKLADQMLLIFNPAVTGTTETRVNGGLIPLHGTRGPGHVCFKARGEDLARWRDYLTAQGIPIESEVDWPQGGHSIYFRDPFGNSLEFATPRIWGLPDAS